MEHSTIDKTTEHFKQPRQLESVMMDLQTAACYGATDVEWGLWWEYWLWCLGHNFDVVGAILSMAHLSWKKGWDAREIIDQFCVCDTNVLADPNDAYPENHW